MPLAAVLVLARTFDLSRAEMGQLVGNKTSHPVKLLGEFWFREGLPNPVERLGPVASRNFIEAATVLAHARSVFGSDIELSGWLREPLAVLSRRRPIDLLSSPETRQEVDAVLTRIEHGVFA